MNQDIEKEGKRGKPRGAPKDTSLGRLRQCIACRVRKSPELLTRLVVIEGNLVIDFERLQPGRGAHVCNSESCVLKLDKKGLLNHAFRLGARRKAKKNVPGADNALKTGGNRVKISAKGEELLGLKSSDPHRLEPHVSGQRSSDSISRGGSILGVDAVMEKLLARINDKDSHI